MFLDIRNGRFYFNVKFLMEYLKLNLKHVRKQVSKNQSMQLNQTKSMDVSMGDVIGNLRGKDFSAWKFALE